MKLRKKIPKNSTIMTLHIRRTNNLHLNFVFKKYSPIRDLNRAYNYFTTNDFGIVLKLIKFNYGIRWINIT